MKNCCVHSRFDFFFLFKRFVRYFINIVPKQVIFEYRNRDICLDDPLDILRPVLEQNLSFVSIAWVW